MTSASATDASGTGRSPRPGLLVAAASVVLGCVAVLVPPPVFEAQDWLQLHEPNRLYLASALAEGRLPLWNPHVALGRPFAADVEAGVFYPPSLVVLPFEPAVALFLLVVAHFALALCGMLFLGRVLTLAPWTAWLAGASFLLSAPVVARLAAGQAPYALATCYLPLVFALGVRLLDRPSPRRLGALALALALQLLCGHPQIAWITWLGLAGLWLGRLVPAGERPPAPRAGGTIALALAVGAALALAGPMLLPFLELVNQGNRSARSLAFATGGSMEWWQWTSLLWPDRGRMVFNWEQNLYGGLLPATLGLAGLAWWRDPNVRGFLAAGAVGAALAAGSRTPLFSLLYSVVPGVSTFRLHGRAGVLLVFALTLSGAIFLSRARASRRTIALLLASAAVGALGPPLYRVLAPGAAVPPPDLATRLLLVCAAAALAAATLSSRDGRGRRALRVALALVILGELGSSIGPERRAWARATDRGGERPLFELLARAGLLARDAAPPRVAVPPWVVRENAAMSYGWAHVAGYNALTLDRVWVYLHQSLDLVPSVADNTYPSGRIYEAGPFPYDSASIVAGWVAGRGFAVRRDPDPRAYVATAARRVRDWRGAVAEMAAGHPFHRVALVEADTSLPAEPAGASGRAEIVSFAPERIEVRTDAGAAGLLVLKEAWYPGWTATVDGSPAPCVSANAWMRAVPVPAGRHTVVLRYRSRWLLPGALVGLVAAGLLSWGAFVRSRS